MRNFPVVGLGVEGILNVKELIFLTKTANLQELQQQNTDMCSAITPEIMTNELAEFENTLYYCQEVGISNFEHLIK